MNGLEQSLRNVETSQLLWTIGFIEGMSPALKDHYNYMYIANCNEMAYRLYGKK